MFTQTLSTSLGASLSERDLRSREKTPLRPQTRSGGEREGTPPLAGNGMVVAKGLRLEKKALTAPSPDAVLWRGKDNRLEEGGGQEQEGVDFWRRPPSGNANVRRGGGGGGGEKHFSLGDAATDSPSQNAVLQLSQSNSGDSNRIRDQLNREFMAQNSKIPLKSYTSVSRSAASKSLSGISDAICSYSTLSKVMCAPICA